MSTAELKELVAKLAVSQVGTERQSERAERRMDDHERRMAEFDSHLNETRRILREVAISQKETQLMQKESERRQEENIRQQQEAEARRQKAEARWHEEEARQQEESARRQEESTRRQEAIDRQLEENSRQQEATDRQLKELGRQIGGLGNKFGSFVEGMSFASVIRILQEEFGMAEVYRRVLVKRDGGREEYDYVAHSDTKNEAMIVEVKSLLDMRGVDRMRRKMNEVFKWLPGHRDKSFQGMVAYVDAHDDAREAVLAGGWHLVHVGEETFRNETPAGFQPKIYRAV